MEKDSLNATSANLAQNWQKEQQLAKSTFVFGERQRLVCTFAVNVVVQHTLSLVLKALHCHSIHDISRLYKVK